MKTFDELKNQVITEDVIAVANALNVNVFEALDNLKVYVNHVAAGTIVEALLVKCIDGKIRLYIDGYYESLEDFDGAYTTLEEAEKACEEGKADAKLESDEFFQTLINAEKEAQEVLDFITEMKNQYIKYVEYMNS